MIKKILTFLLPGNRYQQLLFLFYILISLPLKLIEQPGEGLGASWRISINLALKNDFQWGSDYVFTFGPLGYLYTRLAVFVPQWHIIVFSLFLWVNTLSIARYFILSSKIKGKIHLLTGVIIGLMFCHIVKIEVTSTVMYVVIFYLLHSIKHNCVLSLAIAIIFSTLNLFIKLNYFYPLLLIFSLYYFTILFSREKLKIRTYLLPVLAVQVSLICLIAVGYNINIIGYIKGSWYLATSYNDAMFKPVFDESIVSAYLYNFNPLFDKDLVNFIVISLSVLLTLPIIVIVWANRKKVVLTSISFLTVLFSFLFLFISFKFAFVRHGGLTYLYPPLPLFIFAVITSFADWEIMNSKGVVIMLVILAFIPACLISNLRVMRADNYSYSFLIKKAKKSYQKHFSGKKVIEESERNNITNTHELPGRVKDILGNSTVDIIPLEISIAYFNNLNYNPRPVVQSYAAYNKSLDDLNYRKYISSTAPEYLIYKNESIDNRYHFFDEGRTKLAIRQWYVITDSFNGNLLLKKADTIRQLHIVQKKGQVLELNKVYNLTQNQYLQYATFDIRYSKRGSLMRFLFQPPEVSIKFNLEDGRSIDHRLIISTLQNPVLLSSYIENNTDAWNFFSGNILAVKKIKQIMISAPSWAYEKDIILQLQDVQFR